MFEFVKQIFISAMMFLSCNLLSVNPLKCIPINNQKCKVRPQIVNVQIVNVHSHETIFYPFSIKTSKCSGSCNNINDPYAKMSALDVIKT